MGLGPTFFQTRLGSARNIPVEPPRPERSPTECMSNAIGAAAPVGPATVGEAGATSFPLGSFSEPGAPAPLLPPPGPAPRLGSAMESQCEKGGAGSSPPETAALRKDTGPDPEVPAEPAAPVPPWEEPGLSYWQRFRKSMVRPRGLTMVDAQPWDFPEGYYGWVVVAAAFLVFLFGISLNYTFGVYQRVYFYGGVFPGVSMFQLSWIGSVCFAVQYMIGPLMGRLNERIGARWMTLIGGTLLGLGFIAASFAERWWHLLFTQGLMNGLGSGFLYFSAISLPGQWFSRSKGLALGMAVSGAGLGGLMMAPLTQSLLDRYGWRNSLRITGAIAFGTLYVAASLMRLRFDLMKTTTSRIFDPKFFQDYRFTLLYLAFGTLQFGFVLSPVLVSDHALTFILLFHSLFVPSSYVPSFAQNAAMTTSQGALALGLSQGASAVGRIVVAGLSDRIGPVNVYITCICTTPILTLIIWPFASTFGVLCLFAILFGFFSGGIIATFPTVIASLFGPVDLGSRMGSVFTASLPGNLAASPIAGLILGTTAQTMADGSTRFNYLPVIIYSGLAQMVAATFVVILRFKTADWKLIQRL